MQEKHYAVREFCLTELAQIDYNHSVIDWYIRIRGVSVGRVEGARLH